MPNDNQFKLKTLYIGTRGVKEYRDSIPEFLNERDTVLEIGCEWGTTTTTISQHCKEVIGTDVSPDCIKVAKEKYPQLNFDVLDVFNINQAMQLYKKFKFNKMYIDVSGLSGYSSLLDVIALLNMYSSVFNLELVVVKSGSLKNFAKRCVAYQAKL